MFDHNNYEEPETRRVQLIAGSTYSISLPKKWAEEFKVTKGSELKLVRRWDGSLLLCPETLRSSPNKVLIEVSPHENVETTLRKVISAYLVGCAEIVLRAKPGEVDISFDQRNRIKTFASQLLIGTLTTEYYQKAEPSEEEKLHLKLKVSIDYHSNSPLSEFLIDMRDSTTRLHREALKSLKEVDGSYARKVFETDRNVDSKYYYVIRALKASIVDESVMISLRLRNLREVLGLRHVSKNIERISDHAAKIAVLVAELVESKSYEADFKERLHTLSTENSEKKFIDEIEHLSKKAISVFQSSMDSILNRERLEAFDCADKVVYEVRQKIHNESEGLSNEARDLGKKIPKDFTRQEAQTLAIIIESIRRTTDYSRGIAEVAMNMIFYERMLKDNKDEKGFVHVKLPTLIPKAVNP